MTLPDENVLGLLKSSFVVGWKNIEREEHVGQSHGYGRMHTAVGTTNGAGGSNVQIFVLSPDRVVLHALPGFWHPEDLAAELQFALVVDRLWRDDTRTRAEKEQMFASMHARELRTQSEDTTARSEWQGFDKSRELRLAASKNGDELDTVVVGRDGGMEMKPLNILMRERMSVRPFVAFADFDVDEYVRYGRKYYDNNSGHDKGGKVFSVAERLREKRNRDERREKLLEERRQRRNKKKASS